MGNYTYEKTENMNDLVKEGDYEVKVDSFERKTLPSGKEKLSLRYRIRQDVEQEGKNRCLFEDIWTEKDNPQFFNRKRINQLLGTQNLDDGTEFDTIDDIIEFMTGANLVIHVVVEFDEYYGEDRNRVSYYKSSKIVPKVISSEPVIKNTSEPENTPKTEKTSVIKAIDDDDLPF